jgi:probable HAF family extracellular repeat protein
MRSTRWIPALCLLLASANLPLAARAASLYRVIAFEGADRGFQPRYVNDQGVIAATRHSRAHLYDPATGTLRMLDTLGGSSNAIYAINAAGQVAGGSRTAGDKATHAFLHDGTRTIDLGTLGGTNSQATGINDQGWVVGWSDLPGDRQRQGFVYRDGVMKPLGSTQFYADYSSEKFLPNAISNAGVMPGYGAIRRIDGAGAQETLDYIGGYGAHDQVTDVNERGQVIGGDWRHSALGYQAFVWENGQTRWLESLRGGGGTFASAINDQGVIVGSSIPRDESQVTQRGEYWMGVLWDETGVHDLNDLLEPSQRQWTISTGLGINNLGQIVAMARDRETMFQHYVLLNPVGLDLAYPLPEPSPLWLAGLAVAALLGRSGWARRTLR